MASQQPKSVIDQGLTLAQAPWLMGKRFLGSPDHQHIGFRVGIQQPAQVVLAELDPAQQVVEIRVEHVPTVGG